MRDKIEAGNIEGVDRFDQEPDAGGLELAGGEFQVFDKRLAQLIRFGVLRRDPGQAIDLLAPERGGIVDGLADAVLEFTDACRLAGIAAVAGAPVTRGQVMQDLGQLERLEFVRQLILVVGIGKQVFDAAESGLGGGVEPVQKFDLVEQHGQVGGKLGHRRSFK